MQVIKWVTTKFTSGFTTPAGIYTSPQDITPTFIQGTDNDNRIGNKIRYKRLTINGVFWVLAGLAPPDFCIYRMTIFAARINAPTTSDLYDVATIGGGAEGIFSTIQHKNVRVIYDKITQISVQNNAATVMLPAVKRIKIRRPIFNNVSFANSTQVVPTDPHDKLYLVFGCSAPIASAFPILDMFIKVSFYDN